MDVIAPDGSFLARALSDGAGAIAMRVFSRTPGQQIDPSYLHGVLRRARALRVACLPLDELTCFRLLSGDSEGLPGVTVDRFGDYLVVTLLSETVTPHLDLLYDALGELESPAGIYEQRRTRPMSGDGPPEPASLARGKVAPTEIVVREGDVRFGVDVTAPLHVGMFPDMREGRALVGARAAGKRVLNLFSYSGGFSLYAAKAGAAKIVAVDLAAKAHAKARRNMELSGLDPESVEYVCADAFPTLGRMLDRKVDFDLVICDPPSFSQTKGAAFSATRDWADLAAAAVAVLRPGGLFVACSNTAKLPVIDLERAVGEGALRAGVELSVVGRCGLPADFPLATAFAEGAYLKVIVGYRR
jgi:23S rRNA (cytosine1962-C5)-methyltransferase